MDNPPYLGKGWSHFKCFWLSRRVIATLGGPLRNIKIPVLTSAMFLPEVSFLSWVIKLLVEETTAAVCQWHLL